MNADEFYEEFKAILNYLGCGFAGKEQVTVFIKDGKFHMELDRTEVTLTLNNGEEK